MFQRTEKLVSSPAPPFLQHRQYHSVHSVSALSLSKPIPARPPLPAHDTAGITICPEHGPATRAPDQRYAQLERRKRTHLGSHAHVVLGQQLARLVRVSDVLERLGRVAPNFAEQDLVSSGVLQFVSAVREVRRVGSGPRRGTC